MDRRFSLQFILAASLFSCASQQIQGRSPAFWNPFRDKPKSGPAALSSPPQISEPQISEADRLYQEQFGSQDPWVDRAMLPDLAPFFISTLKYPSLAGFHNQLREELFQKAGQMSHLSAQQRCVWCKSATGRILSFADPITCFEAQGLHFELTPFGKYDSNEKLRDIWEDKKVRDYDELLISAVSENACHFEIVEDQPVFFIGWGTRSGSH
jgi:hypothetical protein